MRRVSWYFFYTPPKQSWLVRRSVRSLGMVLPALDSMGLLTCIPLSGGGDVGIGRSGWKAVWLCRARRLLVAGLESCLVAAVAWKLLVEPSLGGGDLWIGGAGLGSRGPGTSSLGEEPWVSVTWTFAEDMWCRLRRKKTERGLSKPLTSLTRTAPTLTSQHADTSSSRT